MKSLKLEYFEADIDYYLIIENLVRRCDVINKKFESTHFLTRQISEPNVASSSKAL